jgi:hypothetical protein
MKKHIKPTIIITLIITMLSTQTLTACTSLTKSEDTTTSIDTADIALSAEPSIPETGVYDSEDAAIVVSKDTEAKTVKLQNITSGRRYTLTYNGTTLIYDKNDQSLSMDQLTLGSVVTARFYMPTKTLAYIKENPDCVNYKDVSNYVLNLTKGTLTIGGTVYNISAKVVVLSDGSETDMMTLNQVDAITVWGYKNMIYSIDIEKGHGYLRLANEDNFLDGWIEVGSSVISKISKDMLIVVPEGTYTVTVSNKGTVASQEITFNRNEEMSWDLGSIEMKKPETGNIIFTLTPLTAKVSIDGNEVDTSKAVTLEYGLHRMTVTADGYETLSQYIRVAQAQANISIEMEKSEEESSTAQSSAEESSVTQSSEEESGTAQSSEEESSTEESSTEESSTTQVAEAATGSYKVYIDAPEGVEAYLDGNYIGITPTSFDKVAGSYVISLRKTGYQTRSYTLQIDNEEKDLNYTFSELISTSE